MTTFLLGAFTAECLAILGWGLMRRDRVIQYPFLGAAVFMGYLLPQLLGLSHYPFLPEDALDKTIFMAMLCLAAAYWGYTQNRRAARLLWWEFDVGRLRIASAVLSLAGAFFFFKVSQLAAEVTAETGGAWTGIITIYIFFAGMLTVGFSLALILHLRQSNRTTLLIILFDLFFYLDRILIKGRRSAMAELLLIAVMALWFNRRWSPPRWAMIAALTIGALVVNSIGDYRSTMLGEDRTTWSGAGLKEIWEIDYLGNLRDLANGSVASSDLINTVMNIEAADRLLSFDYGLAHWNGFVNAFVPGQWVGHDVKRSLMIDFDNAAYSQFGHVAHRGSTITGVSDAFQSFWYFGAVKFFLIGLIMSRWYTAAVQGSMAAEIVLMFVINSSLLAITHNTLGFFPQFIYLAAFSLPALQFARIRPVKRWSTYPARLGKSGITVELVPQRTP